MSMVRSCFAAAAALAATVLIGLWLYAGPYGLNVLLRYGGTWWVTVDADSPWLYPAMRLALRDAPIAEPGGVAWRAAETGFYSDELPQRPVRFRPGWLRTECPAFQHG